MRRTMSVGLILLALVVPDSLGDQPAGNECAQVRVHLRGLRESIP